MKGRKNGNAQSAADSCGYVRKHGSYADRRRQSPVGRADNESAEMGQRVGVGGEAAGLPIADAAGRPRA
jgi:hypothetical protein